MYLQACSCGCYGHIAPVCSQTAGGPQANCLPGGHGSGTLVCHPTFRMRRCVQNSVHRHGPENKKMNCDHRVSQAPRTCKQVRASFGIAKPQKRATQSVRSYPPNPPPPKKGHLNKLCWVPDSCYTVAVTVTQAEARATLSKKSV